MYTNSQEEYLDKFFMNLRREDFPEGMRKNTYIYKNRWRRGQLPELKVFEILITVLSHKGMST